MAAKRNRGTAASGAARTASNKRGTRKRPIPQWLKEQNDLDAMAQRRCMMILRVLSGDLSVTDAVAEAKISRQLYYQYETRALRAMLSALMPGSGDESGSQASTQSERIAALEAKVTQLEKDKRRAERLLFVTRQLLRSGPLTTGRGRPPKRRNSTTSGARPSRGSRTTSATKKGSEQSSPSDSIQTADSGVAR